MKEQLRLKERVILIGGGNHVQYCIDIIERQGLFDIAGIVDSRKEIGESVYGYNVIGRQETIRELINTHHVDKGLITIGDNWGRYHVHKQLIELVPDFEFINAIHPSVIIGNNVKLGIGIVAMAGCIINPGATIGDFTFFATGAQVEHDCTIGDFASISAGSIMGGHVNIGKYSAITLGVTIMDRVNIGENTVVGSGSLVHKDLPPGVLAYGNPVQIVRNRIIGEKFLK